jgi:type II secretory pathway component PulC
MRMLKINMGSIGAIGDMVLASLSRLSVYWPFSWRGVSAMVLGVLLAKWFWIFLAPQATFSAAVPERAAGLEAGQLFGVAVSTEAASEGVALPNVQLLGVFAAGAGKKGFAVLKLDNRQMGVAVGDEVAAGTKLVDVQADHVLLERAGVQQRVNLENKYAGSANGSASKGAVPAYGAAAGSKPNDVVNGNGNGKAMQNNLRQPRR